MTKKLLTSAVAFVMFAAPVSPAIHADAGAWESMMATAAWNHGDYTVERLAFSAQVIGPISFGDAVIVAEPTNVPGRVDAFLLKSGLKKPMGNIPQVALSEKRFQLNDERFIYVNPIDEAGNHYTVIERNLETGEAITLVSDVFLNGATDVDVMTDGTDLYFNAVIAFSNTTKSWRQAAVYVWNKEESKAYSITQHWDLHNEKLLDAQGGVALVQMTFESGNKQLWLMDSRIIDARRGKMEAVPGTWIESDGSFAAAHFRSDGSIEYFQNFVRHTYKPGVDAQPVRYDGELLNWFRPAETAYQIVDDYMAWVNPEDVLSGSDIYATGVLGVAPGGLFTVARNSVFFGNKEVRGVSGTTIVTLTLSGAVMDFSGTTYVLLTWSGDVIYAPSELNHSVRLGVYRPLYGMRLGYGSSPVLSDETHVYWKGTDGIYEATIAVDAALAVDSTGRFPAGTKVKFTSGPKVYRVGSDGKLHWLMTENVALAIYGATWNKGILEFTEGGLSDYAIGSPIDANTGVQNI